MMMKSAFAALAFFVASACAQDVYITYPKSGSTVQAGKNLTVTISQPNDLTPVSNIAAAIGMNHCESESSCPSAQQLGYLVYSGLIEFEQYDPTQPPYANITVQPLSSFSGLYSLNAAVYSVVGAGPTASIETANILLNVE